MNGKRFIASIVIILSIIFLPYWVYLPLLVTALVYFPFYWEGIILGLIIDALYGRMEFDYIYYSVGFWSLLVLVTLLPLRKLIRTYA